MNTLVLVVQLFISFALCSFFDGAEPLVDEQAAQRMHANGTGLEYRTVARHEMPTVTKSVTVPTSPTTSSHVMMPCRTRNRTIEASKAYASSAKHYKKNTLPHPQEPSLNAISSNLGITRTQPMNIPKSKSRRMASGMDFDDFDAGKYNGNVVGSVHSEPMSFRPTNHALYEGAKFETW